MRLQLDFAKNLGKGKSCETAITVLLACEVNIVNVCSQFFLPFPEKTCLRYLSTIPEVYQLVSIFDPGIIYLAVYVNYFRNS